MTATSTRRLLTSKEAAAYLGITERLMRDLRDRRAIPATKLGHRTLRFDVKQLDRWIERNTEAAS